MSDHALLSASGASRWMKCPPSARLEQEFPESTSSFANEGRQAHLLAEALLRLIIQDGTFADITNTNDVATAHKLTKNSSAEMLRAVQDYYDVCVEKISAAVVKTPSARILIEQRLDFSEWVPEGFGTGDLVIIADGLIEVVDLKYGKGVPVSAVDNPQMKLYGLGAVDTYAHMYDFDSISMTIVQPRLDSESTETIQVSKLLEWGEKIRPIARQAFEGVGEFGPGNHCRFCRAKVKCRARAEENLELTRHDFQHADLMSDGELTKILAVANRLQAWANDLQSYALVEAEKGKEWPGWKLVAGRAVRKYADADKVAERLLGAGYPDVIIYERALLGITAMEKAIGKKRFGELLMDLIITPLGKPALVPESDKRPAINKKEETRKEFEEAI